MSITRRKFVAGLGATAVAAVGAGNYFIKSLRRRQPNIILFVADDMRFDAAGFAGNAIIKTPQLDRLAGQGVVFDNNFVTTSVCPISRASIMSGDYALRHGVYDFFTQMKAASFQHSFPVLMRHAGYHTGFIGKWGMGGQQPVKLFDQWLGFVGQGDYFPVKDQHMTDIQTQQALDFINHCPQEKPFLLIIAYKAPHEPLIPQSRYADLYKNAVIPKASTNTPLAAAQLPPLIAQSADRRDYFASMLNDDKQYQVKMKQYYRMITGIDDSVGLILRQLSTQKKWDDTCVLFTSDNGLLEGEHGLEGKWCMYEESIRVPLVMRLAPRFFSSAQSMHIKGMSLNIDLSPTILDMAGLAAPPHIQGMSLLPLVQESNAPWRKGFYYEHPGWPTQYILACEGYRGARWKYTRYVSGKSVNECLFNLPEDPNELKNLAAIPQYHDILQWGRSAVDEEKKAILKI